MSLESKRNKLKKTMEKKKINWGDIAELHKEKTGHGTRQNFRQRFEISKKIGTFEKLEKLVYGYIDEIILKREETN